MINILGLSAYYHDSAACLIQDGVIIAAAQEERFTRKKHDATFPKHAIEYCLQESKITPDQIDYIAYYEKPFIKFERILETYLHFAPRGFGSFLKAMPLWLKEKLFLSNLIKKELNDLFHLSGKNKINWEKRMLFTEHHHGHAASAFFPSPFQNAAILTVDGVGEWATTSIGHGTGHQLNLLNEIHFPHSLGLLYSAFTYYTGFKVNSGEYKVMGLAPYGEPKYVNKILDHLIDLKDDGSFHLNMAYFNYCTGLTMTNERFHALFEGPPRLPESKITQKEMDLARSIQDVTELVMLKLARHAIKITGEKNLCLAGGVALNCVVNGKMLKEKIADKIWIQPSAGDAGAALGAALSVWHQFLDKPRIQDGFSDNMKGSYLGPAYDNNDIELFLRQNKIPYEQLADNELTNKISHLLTNENVLGWFQGRMEFGPRALGNRSILGDPRSANMQSKMNLKIKHRESFRPFAPSVTDDALNDFFDIPCKSDYMLFVAPIAQKHCIPLSDDEKNLWGIDRLKLSRSDIPSVTHVDYSARIQSVSPNSNYRYYELINKFGAQTGVPIIINTSFNVRGEPIVCTPEDAYRCFMRTDMDYLVLGNFLLDKSKQPKMDNDTNWKQEFELD